MKNLNKTEILTWVKKYLNEEFDIQSIDESSELINDLELDSLEVFAMLADMEDEFKVSIPESLTRQMVTVHDMCELVAKL